jgi:hypothetical protein
MPHQILIIATLYVGGCFILHVTRTIIYRKDFVTFSKLDNVEKCVS